MEKLNVATPAAKAERKRIPMSVQVQRLEAQEIPGYHLHWFTGDSARIARAQAAGYEFVGADELSINSVGIGTDSIHSGNTDMGSRVSIVSGQEVGKDGQPMRLVLMKIKLELYEEDQSLVEAQNEKVAASIRGGYIGSEKDAQGDRQHRYVDEKRTNIPNLFTPKRSRTA
jgi:hypothetical protein